MMVVTWSSLGDVSGKEPACQCRRHERQIQSLRGEDSLEKRMATLSRILAWRIPWTEEPGGLKSIESQSWTWLRWLSRHHAIKGLNFVQSHSLLRIRLCLVYYLMQVINILDFGLWKDLWKVRGASFWLGDSLTLPSCQRSQSFFETQSLVPPIESHKSPTGESRKDLLHSVSTGIKEIQVICFLTQMK